MSNIAIIGSGISGLTCAYLLGREHQITLFEANDYIGGHTATVHLDFEGEKQAIDTGFVVFNDHTYPNFLQLLRQIEIKAKPTVMSFSVQHTGSGIEYMGSNLSSLFAQKSNLLSARYYRFLFEIIRFNRVCKQTLYGKEYSMADTLGEFLTSKRFSDFFAQHYILPMVAAIWSASLNASKAFPLEFFLRFFNNHGLLNVVDRPQWFVLEGGSRSYIPAMTSNIDSLRLNSPVTKVLRRNGQIDVMTETTSETFDDVIIACHSDQALELLGDPSNEERTILSNLHYRDNEVTLHTDQSLLPTNQGAWASWNFYHDEIPDAAPSVTYNMNILQGLQSRQTFCVTLNRNKHIDPDKILRRFTYAHPEFSLNTLQTQTRRNQICGHNHTHYCGAYWYNGFHEDGLNSALDVCKRFGVKL